MNVVSLMPSGSWQPNDFFSLFPKKDKSDRIRLQENRKNYVVIAEIPGFIKDEINIQFRNGILNIYASSYTVTRHVGTPSFYSKKNIHRTIPLRNEVDEKQIRYLYEKNVLRIWIPKKRSQSSIKAFDILRKFGLLPRLRRR